MLRSLVRSQLYRRVLSLDERSALAHAGLGLLLLGTGTRNFAAVSACGINQIEALEHLKVTINSFLRQPASQPASHLLHVQQP